MIIDSHAHVSKSALANPEKLIEDMNLAGIDKAVIVPGGMLDIRKMTEYTTGRERPRPVEPDNQHIAKCIDLYPDRFIGFYCLNPMKEMNEMLEELEIAIQQGFKGIKLAPLVHQMSFSDESVARVVAFCGEKGIPLYTHVTVREATSTFALEALVANHPKTTIIIGHMGLGDVDQHAIMLASEFDNVYLETSLAPILALKLAIDQLGVEKLLFGTEFPLSDPLIEYEKIRRLPISEKEKKMILGENMARLLRFTTLIGQGREGNEYKK